MIQYYSRIESLLRSKNISLRKMCLAIGIFPQAYSNSKSRDAMLCMETTLKIAEFLDTSVEYLVTGKTENHSDDKLEKIKAVLAGSMPLYDADSFWTNVKWLCRTHKISQKDLSEALGWNARTIENKIQLHTEPTVSEAVSIANYFKCSLYSLLNKIDTVQDESYYLDQLKAIKNILDNQPAS